MQGRLQVMEKQQKQCVSALQHLRTQHAAALRTVSLAKTRCNAAVAQQTARKEQVCTQEPQLLAILAWISQRLSRIYTWSRRKLQRL
mmetsp:Transcript_31265/g.81481  ORF Transcript_31265/g.81481 Transcript_31265/m.81481 type:complete len:87 (-) Transcript_31265:811-1071(-)